ncbi:MAG: sigma-70 family RNA polymerase sigma factor [Acidimicrobiia bacterium]
MVTDDIFAVLREEEMTSPRPHAVDPVPHPFASWYAEANPRVAAIVAVHARDPQVAEDVTAEAFTRAFERWKRVSMLDSPTAWTVTVALNALRRHHRRAGLERRLLRRYRPAEFTLPASYDHDLWDAVRSLPPRARTAVALRYLGGLTEPEIASTMGIATGTVAATLSKARARLAEELGGVNDA